MPRGAGAAARRQAGVRAERAIQPGGDTKPGYLPRRALVDGLAGEASPEASAPRLDDEQYKKTVLCRFYSDGICSRGAGCSFAHGAGELQRKPDLAKTSLCLGWLAGGCCLSSRACTFAHGRDELRTVGVLGAELSQVRRRRHPERRQGPQQLLISSPSSRQKTLALHRLLLPPTPPAEEAATPETTPDVLARSFDHRVLEKLLREAEPECYED